MPKRFLFLGAGLISLFVTPVCSRADDPLPFLLKWGAYGTGDGQFRYPRDVATDASGNVYVTDILNDRIQKFDGTGTYLTQWGATGTGDGQFNWPSQIGFDGDGNVYVGDANNHRIQKFTSTGSFIEMWGWGVADGSASYQRCTSGCHPGIPGTGDGQFNGAIGLATNAGGDVYVADNQNHRIQKFDGSGTYLTQWGSTGTGNGQFQYPNDVATDASGNVYVADALNQRIQKFDGTGTYLTQWGSFGTGDGQFQYPIGVATDAGGDVYVADDQNHRIQKFEGTGTYLTQWGSFGTGDGQFKSPNGVATDATGNVYVVDHDNHRIQKFSIAPVAIVYNEEAPMLRLERIHPSPTWGAFTVAFSLTGEASAWLEVVDVAGRRVLRQEIGHLRSGPHSLKLGEGESLAAGVYSVRLSEGGRTVSRTVAVVR